MSAQFRRFPQVGFADTVSLAAVADAAENLKVLLFGRAALRHRYDVVTVKVIPTPALLALVAIALEYGGTHGRWDLVSAPGAVAGLPFSTRCGGFDGPDCLDVTLNRTDDLDQLFSRYAAFHKQGHCVGRYEHYSSPPASWQDWQ